MFVTQKMYFQYRTIKTIYMFETSVEMKQAMFVLSLQNFATVVPFVIIIIGLICLTNLKDLRLIVKSFILKTYHLLMAFFNNSLVVKFTWNFQDYSHIIASVGISLFQSNEASGRIVQERKSCSILYLSVLPFIITSPLFAWQRKPFLLATAALSAVTESLMPHII